MRQRLALAAALLGEPAILLLDEPANDLDVTTGGLGKVAIRVSNPPNEVGGPGVQGDDDPGEDSR